LRIEKGVSVFKPSGYSQRCTLQNRGGNNMDEQANPFRSAVESISIIIGIAAAFALGLMYLDAISTNIGSEDQYLIKEKTEMKDNYVLILGYTDEKINQTIFKETMRRTRIAYIIPKNSKAARILKEGDIITFTWKGDMALVLK